MSEQKPLSKPKASSKFAQKELDKAEKQFQAFDENIKEMTMDRMNKAPKEESEGPKLSQKEISKSKDIYLKPKRTIAAIDAKSGQGQKFNEKFREAYNFAKEYVQFMAENKEIGGEDITLWTRPFGGLDAEEWVIPVNKPVWGPRYLAEQIKRKYYHRLVMRENVINSADNMGSYYGSLAADTTIQRLDAHPVSQRKSLFMGSTSF